MNYEALRQNLIDGTIRVIAKDGLDHASTKQICSSTAINEAYIYRCFENKEDLLAKTFSFLDEEFVGKILQHIPVMYMQELDYETRCRLFFAAVWGFVIGNHEKCQAYIQYYYSPYFMKYSSEEHKQRFVPVVNKFRPAFCEEADVWMILSHLLNVILAFAVMVHNNAMRPDDDYTEHVFRVLYQSIKQYFKTDKECDS